MGHYWDSKVDYRVDFIVPSQLIVIFVQDGRSRRKAWATLGARWLGLQCANVKKAAGKGSMLFPAARPGRHLQRRRPESFLSPTPLAEARSALGALLAHWEHSEPLPAPQELRALRPLSAPRLLEPRRVRRTAGISRRSRHRTHSGTSCKSARPSSLMLV